MKAANKRKEGI